MAPINSNYIKSGSTIQNAITKNTTFNVGATGGDDYGPTNQTGFYKGIIPPPGGYTIYMHKESQGPSIHVAHDDEQCIFFLKSFGATGSTISDVLAWSTGRTDIWVQTQEITLQDLPNNNSLLVYLDTGNLSSYNGSGNTWFDLQGENDATLYNTPTYSSNYNGILNFNDTSLEYGTIPNLGDLNTWTVEVWFRISTTLSTGKITSIVSNEYNLSDKLNFSIGTNNSPINYNLSVGFYDGAWRSTTGFVPEINTWYQVVGTYDGTTLKQYVNGNLSGGTLSYVGSPQSGGETRLMRRWDSSLTSNNMVNGDLAIVKIYNTAISSENILQSYNNTYTRFNTPSTSTPTPIPATSTPVPATSTPTPTITNTPIPATSTPTPEPTSTSTPVPATNTPTPLPTATSTPTPTIVSPVSSGLELYYDPSNSSSYPGSGTTLYDLSSSAVNATLSGSPTDSGNWFTFTGTQSIQTGNLFSLFSGWQHSLEIWFSPSAAGSVFSDTGAGPTNTGYHSSGLEVYQTGPFYNLNAMLYNGTAVTRVGGGIPTLNNWYQLVRVYNGSNLAYAYLNKVKSSDTSITWSNPTPGWYLNFGSSESTFFATGNRFQGKIGVIRLYNRVLTQSEVTQNFDAEKSKYGL